jgi:hypothetical protein
MCFVCIFCIFLCVHFLHFLCVAYTRKNSLVYAMCVYASYEHRAAVRWRANVHVFSNPAACQGIASLPFTLNACDCSVLHTKIYHRTRFY